MRLAVLYSVCRYKTSCLSALIKSADLRLISPQGFSTSPQCRLGGPGLTSSPSHLVLPCAILLCATSFIVSCFPGHPHSFGMTGKFPYRPLGQGQQLTSQSSVKKAVGSAHDKSKEHSLYSLYFRCFMNFGSLAQKDR